MKPVILSLSAVTVGTGLWLMSNTGLHCGQSKESTTQLFVNESIKTAFDHFNAGVGRYPTTAEGLSALLQAPLGTEKRWNGPYLPNQRLPLDPWGRDYHYRSPGLKNPASYDLWSLGPDGIPSADDIGNWSK